MSRILIADDSMFMRSCLKSILVDAGHEVVGEATTGIEAVELFSKLSPDIITMDITMPQMSGIEALQSIMKLNKEACVIIFTSNNKPEAALEALNNGAKNYITKPFEKDKILKAINDVAAKTV